MVHCGNVRQTASIVNISDSNRQPLQDIANVGGSGGATSASAASAGTSRAGATGAGTGTTGADSSSTSSLATSATATSAVTSTTTTTSAERKVIRTGDRAYVRFRFIQYPELLPVGARILFREGRTKGVGKITRVFYE